VGLIPCIINFERVNHSLIWTQGCVNLKNYKGDGYSLFPMFKTAALYAIVISSLVVASVFNVSFVPQQASAQGNQTSGGSSSNQSSSNSTSGGAPAGGSTTGTSGGNRY
jgi:uncharacterized membrane protein